MKLLKYKKNIRYPKTLKVDNIEYHFVKRYPHYAMYENELGFKECFTPIQIQDVYFKKIREQEKLKAEA